MLDRLTIRLFLILFCTSLFIFTFSQIGVSAYERLQRGPEVYPESTFIGPIDISGMTEAEAMAKLESAIRNWKNTNRLSLSFETEDKQLKMEIFAFDRKGSIDKAKQSKHNQLSVTIDRDRLQVAMIDLLGGDDAVEQIAVDRMINDLRSTAQSLKMIQGSLSLENYLIEKQGDSQIVSTGKIDTLGNHETMQIKRLIGTSGKAFVIAPESTFSIGNAFKDVVGSTDVSNSLTMIASAMYEAVLKTNFRILERQVGQDFPDAIKPGFEAKVLLGKTDFSVQNPNKTPYTITFSFLDEQLTATIEGQPFLRFYEVVSDIQKIEPRTTFHYSPLLMVGEEQVENEGSPGVQVEVYKLVYDNNRHLVTKQLISQDYYSPKNRIKIVPIPAGGEEVQSGTELIGENNEEILGGEAGKDLDDNEISKSKNSNLPVDEHGHTAPSDVLDPTLWDVPNEIEKGF